MAQPGPAARRTTAYDRKQLVGDIIRQARVGLEPGTVVLDMVICA